MKKYILILFAIVFAVSCNDDKFLEERTYIDDTNSFFQNQSSIEISLASCYSEVQYMTFGNIRGGSEHNWMLMGLGLDTFTSTNGNLQFTNWPSLKDDSGYARHYGEYMYKLVNRANATIDMIDENEDIEYSDGQIKNTLRAEAVFMRAWAYRVIAGMFGAAVYNDHMTQEARYDYEMLPREAVWEKVAEDFKYAEENLPVTPRMMGTVTKAAAAHYLAETYLALGKFSEAEAAATRVISKQDGNYQLMTTRFGNRKDQAKDRYGNSLAAPQGAYWDLFRSSAMTDGKEAADSNPNDPDNKEAIWVAQIDYAPGVDSWPLGGSGDSWFRMHLPIIESVWAPWIPIGGKNGTRTDKNGEKFYVFTADATCYPLGVKVDGAGTPAADIPEAQGRMLAYNLSTRIDSLACRTQGNGAATGLGFYAVDYISRPYGHPLGSYWDDPNDFRGSEVMIQRDYFTPSGKKWSQVRRQISDRIAAHPGDNAYVLTVADTINITPRYWKFSDDKHPFVKDNINCIYDCDWYMIRIAETYLLRAEARLAQGNKGGAAEDINVIRARAGAKACSANDINIDYILDERARELFAEEHRWITLSRLSCNPNATYVLDRYPTQNNTTSNTFYERTRKYGFGYENEDRGREAYTNPVDGKTYHYPNVKPYNYLLPIPIQIIQSNKDVKIEQNYGY